MTVPALPSALPQNAMPAEIFNPNPVIFSAPKSAGRLSDLSAHSLWINDSSISEDEADEREPIDQDEIYGMRLASSSFPVYETFTDLIRSIYDPEHPNTLEELRVVSAPQVTVGTNRIKVEFTPTVPHCGMSTLIGKHLLLRPLRVPSN